MAKDKKGVILYCDLIHTVTKLSDDEAGKLFKHYLAYINDLNPEIEDKLIQIVFEPIKQNLKRDLKKWEKQLKQRSNAGKKGMENRWHKPITNDNRVISVITDDNKPLQDITNITDIVKENVTVNVNVKENVILREKPDETIFYSIEHCVEVALNDPRWVKSNKAVRSELEKFNEYLEKAGVYEKNPMDYKSHFSRFKTKCPEKLLTAAVISLDEWHKLAAEYDKNKKQNGKPGI
jgi:hypothetical protein